MIKMSNTVVKKSGKSGIRYIIPNLRQKAFQSGAIEYNIIAGFL